MSASMKFLELHAREKLGAPSNWYAYNFEVKDSPYGSFYEVTGAIAPLLTKGPNRGKPNWKAKDKETKAVAQIQKQEHQKWVEEWEKETGICSTCENTGKEWIGWSQETGSRYKPCSRCGKNGLELQGQLSLSV
jgi:hypothetical protein